MNNTLHAWLTQLQHRLTHHSPTPRSDALALLQAVCQHDLLTPINQPQNTLSDPQMATLEAWQQRRLQGEPIAYIIGQQPFWSHVFHLTPDTLIPRPETEHLIEQVLATLPSSPCKLLDMGTGSGNIVITLALARPHWQCMAIDCSQSALDVAKKNATRLGADITWLYSHWWQALQGQRFDVITANPPYLAAHDHHLNQGDLRFEPKQALASKATGVEDLACIIEGATEHLTPNGWLFLEHGFDQGDWVADQLAACGLDHIKQTRDLQGHVRISQAQRSHAP